MQGLKNVFFVVGDFFPRNLDLLSDTPDRSKAAFDISGLFWQNQGVDPRGGVLRISRAPSENFWKTFYSSEIEHLPTRQVDKCPVFLLL